VAALLVPRGALAIHDHCATFPGVEEAVREAGLAGYVEGGVFVWRKPPDVADPLDAEVGCVEAQ
jgi:hypothetical protein